LTIDFFTGIPEQTSSSLDTPTGVLLIRLTIQSLPAAIQKLCDGGSATGPQFVATRLQTNALVAGRPMFDFIGDGNTDIAVWRAGAQACFYILNSSNNTFRAEQCGRRLRRRR